MAQAQTIPESLQKLALYIGGFFSGLSLLVSSLPHLENIPRVVPSVPSQELADWGATVLCLGIVGHGYLRTKAGHKLITGTGLSWLLGAIALAVSYTHLGLPAAQQIHGDVYMVLLVFWYIAIYCLIAKGFWEMGLFAYAADGRIKPKIASPAPSLSAVLSDWWRSQRDSRKKQSKARAANRLAELRSQIAELEQSRHELETAKNKLEARLANKEKREAEKLAEAARNKRAVRHLKIAVAFLGLTLAVLTWLIVVQPMW